MKEYYFSQLGIPGKLVFLFGFSLRGFLLAHGIDYRHFRGV
jgi:hypothetical protein